MQRALNWVYTNADDSNINPSSTDYDIKKWVEFIRHVNRYQQISYEIFERFRKLWIVTISSNIYDFYLFIMSKDGLALRFVPDLDKYPYLCNDAVMQNGLALQFVPEQYKAPDIYSICLHAILNNPHAIRYIAEQHRTLDMCKCVVYQDVSLYNYCKVDGVIKNITTQMVMFIVSQKPQYISMINGIESMRIPAKHLLVMFAVSRNPEVIKLVDDAYKNETVCHIAVKHNGLLLEYVPKEFQKQYMISDAIGNNPLALEFVKVEKTESICTYAFKKDIRHIYMKYNRHMHNPSVFEKLRYKLGQNLNNVPLEFRTRDICRRAYLYHPSAKPFIPPEILETMTDILQS
jgi:hypothetical protein